MPKYTLDLTDAQDAGVTFVREAHNSGVAEDDRLADNAAYLQNVAGKWADDYARQAEIKAAPETVIAEQAVRISQLEGEKAALEAQVATASTGLKA